MFKLSLYFRQSFETDINSYLWSLDQFNSLSTTDNYQDDTNKQSVKKSEIDFFSSQFIRVSRTQANKSASSKQHFITPVVQRLCKYLDEDLSKLLNDIEYVANGESNARKTSTEQQNDDLKNFNEYLQSNLELFCERTCSSLGDLVDNLKLNSTNSKFEGQTILCLDMQRILLICRFAHALPNNTFYLRACYSNLVQQQHNKSLQNESSMLSNILKKKQINEQKVNFL